MAYFAPYIDATGLHIPTYTDIENYFVQNARIIFGEDIYLENDSQDFQYIAIFALAVYQSFLAAQYSYNSRSPISAVGVGLDAVVSLNGIRRKGATFSTATVLLTGTAGQVVDIVNGVVADVSGNLWDLPDNVTIGITGSTSVTAICQTPGPITAGAGQISRIETPTFGWTAVTNLTSAVPGQGQELDAELRSRQAISVEQPSQALTGGILSSVLNLENVISAALYENDTNAILYEINGATNPNGFPGHSITVVVQGGDGQTIANTIDLRKTPGCYTNGDQSYEVIGEDSVTNTIRFFRQQDVYIDILIRLKALNGYTGALQTAVIEAAYNHTNGLGIGQMIINSEIWQAVLNSDTQTKPRFSVREILAGYHGSGYELSNEDLAIEFDQTAATNIAYITVELI